jgi:hypothetical protein
MRLPFYGWGYFLRSGIFRIPIIIFTREAKGRAFPFLADVISATCLLLWTESDMGKDFALALSKRSNDT